MPRRYSNILRSWIYRYLVMRDGEYCHWCGKTLDQITKELKAQQKTVKIPPETVKIPPENNKIPLGNTIKFPSKLEIDHVDGNRKNDDPSNLVLACKTCNVTRGNQNRPSPSDRLNMCVCNEREDAFKRKKVIKQMVNYGNEDTPATTQLNYFFETDFKQYVINRVYKEVTVAKDDLALAGSQRVGCSVSAARNYLGQLLSSIGPLREDPDMLMGKFVTWKEDVNPANYLTKEMRSL